MTGFKDTGIPILFQPAISSLNNFKPPFQDFTNSSIIFYTHTIPSPIKFCILLFSSCCINKVPASLFRNKLCNKAIWCFNGYRFYSCYINRPAGSYFTNTACIG